MFTCYSCNKPSTGVEHAPPKCLFPKASEFRVNLITVPSCDLHNSSKSKDDELLRHVLASAPGNNSFAVEIYEKSIIPSWERRPHLLETFLPRMQRVNIGNSETASFSIDLDRFHSSLQQVVKALYFHEYGKKLDCTFEVIWAAQMTSDLSEAPYFDVIAKWEAIFPPINRGSNPKIFLYDFPELVDDRHELCRMRFFEGMPVYVLIIHGQS